MTEIADLDDVDAELVDEVVSRVRRRRVDELAAPSRRCRDGPPAARRRDGRRARRRARRRRMPEVVRPPLFEYFVERVQPRLAASLPARRAPPDGRPRPRQHPAGLRRPAAGRARRRGPPRGRGPHRHAGPHVARRLGLVDEHLADRFADAQRAIEERAIGGVRRPGRPAVAVRRRDREGRGRGAARARRGPGRAGPRRHVLLRGHRRPRRPCDAAGAARRRHQGPRPRAQGGPRDRSARRSSATSRRVPARRSARRSSCSAGCGRARSRRPGTTCCGSSASSRRRARSCWNGRSDDFVD